MSEVLSSKLAGDRTEMIAAASRLWLLPEEQDGVDAASHEVWQAIESVDAVAAAVEAGVTVIRARQRVRASAFIDIIEHIKDPALLLELATVVEGTEWPTHPYLASVFLWLIELKQEDALWRHMQQHRERLQASTAGWILFGVVLTASRVGTREDVAACFRGWDKRPGVPMWIIANYLATLSHVELFLPDVARIAAKAWTTATHDATDPFVRTFTLAEYLRQKRDAEFLALAREPAALPANLDYPLVRYINSAKRKSPIVATDFKFSLETQAVGQRIDLSVRPINWRVIILLQEIPLWVTRGERVLPLFAAMLETTRGAPEALVLYRAMLRAYPKSFPIVQDAWRRVAATRTTLLQRLKADYL